MYRSLMTAVAVVLSVSTQAAVAADGAPHDWSGYYIGVDLGGARSKTNLTNTVSDPALNWTDFGVGDSLGYTRSGLLGGAHVGLNFQQDRFLYGAELSAFGAGISGGGTLPPNLTGSAGDDVFVSKILMLLLATARVGYTFDQTLLYAKAGYAGAKVSTSVADSVGSLGAGSNSAWRSGFALGAGVEHAVASNWTLGLEYDYARLGSASINLGNTAPYVFNDKSRNVHMIVARLGYKFSGN
ncbi:outer membrane beta-barrel protein [Hoeflea sp. AS60]|uniref:outer membrane protein n=1 Tax=Hoeflea sp. AS60 TaxID=3135780 RepID=UPI00316D9CF7